MSRGLAHARRFLFWRPVALHARVATSPFRYQEHLSCFVMILWVCHFVESIQGKPIGNRSPFLGGGSEFLKQTPRMLPTLFGSLRDLHGHESGSTQGFLVQRCVSPYPALALPHVAPRGGDSYPKAYLVAACLELGKVERLVAMKPATCSDGVVKTFQAALWPHGSIRNP